MDKYDIALNVLRACFYAFVSFSTFSICHNILFKRLIVEPKEKRIACPYLKRGKCPYGIADLVIDYEEE